MTTASGNYTVSVQYSHLQNWDIDGCLTITGDDITVSNVRMHDTGCSSGMIYIASTAERVVIKDVELDCEGANNTGLRFHDVTAIRNDIHGCENGISLNTGGADGAIVVRDNYIHDLNTGEGTHSDGIEVGEGVSNLTIDHNTIVGSSGINSPIILYNDSGTQNANVTIHHNLLSGGGYGIQCPRYGSPSGITINTNRFGTFSYAATTYCTISGGHIQEWYANHLDSDETAVSQY
jgi:hypothetical protein